MDLILINRDGKQYGPYTRDEFSKYSKMGQILPTDMFWMEGMLEWVECAQYRNDNAEATLPTRAVKFIEFLSSKSSEKQGKYLSYALFALVMLILLVNIDSIKSYKPESVLRTKPETEQDSTTQNRSSSISDSEKCQALIARYNIRSLNSQKHAMNECLKRGEVGVQEAANIEKILRGPI